MYAVVLLPGTGTSFTCMCAKGVPHRTNGWLSASDELLGKFFLVGGTLETKPPIVLALTGSSVCRVKTQSDYELSFSPRLILGFTAPTPLHGIVFPPHNITWSSISSPSSHIISINGIITCTPPHTYCLVITTAAVHDNEYTRHFSRK